MKECLLRLEKDEDTWLFIDLTSLTDWSMALYGAHVPLSGMRLDDDTLKALTGNNGVLVRSGGRMIFGEPVNFAGKVFVFGGGHVAQALEPVLTTVGFRCVIFENRGEFVSRELFPSAYDLIIGDYEQVDQKINVTPNDYIVIVTHAWDLAVLRQVVAKDCAYIGVIGSKTKVATLKQQLNREGISDELINRIISDWSENPGGNPRRNSRGYRPRRSSG
jgi:xanthine dehydrogenase accessory factor